MMAGGHGGETTSSVSAPYVVNLEFRGAKPWHLIVHSAERFRLLFANSKNSPDSRSSLSHFDQQRNTG